MNLLRFFQFAQEKALAQQLADQLAKELPPKFMESGSNKLSVNKVTRSLERVYQEALGHDESRRRMGLVRRSVFANTFKWSLKEIGYSAEFCDVATEGLIIELAKARNS